MNTEAHDIPPPLVSMVSDDNSDDDYIGAPQLSEGEPLRNDVPPDRPIPPEPPPQK